LDLLVTNYISDNVSVLLNNGAGVFVAAAPVAVVNGPREVEAGDLDGDGDIDFLATNYSGNSVSVRLNDGHGAFSSGGDVAVGAAPKGLALGDLDGDGDLDFVAANYASNTVSVMLNNGHATFTAAIGSSFAVGVSPGGVVMGDFDRDGDLDLSTANFGSNTASILINTAARYSVTTSTLTTVEGGDLVFTVHRNA